MKYNKQGSVENKSSNKQTILLQIILAIGFGILINLILVSYQWGKFGFNAALIQVKKANAEQYAYFNKTQSSPVGATIARAAEHTRQVFVEGYDLALKKVRAMLPPNHKAPAFDRFQSQITSIKSVFERAMLLFSQSILTVILKLFCLLAGIAMYTMGSLMGALDGLAARYVRTEEGGRESTFFFHHITDKIIRLPPLIILAYLVGVFSPDPGVFVLLLGISLFSFFFIATSNLKKFL